MKNAHNFKIGDKVIASEDITGCGYITQNKVYEVVGVSFDDICIISDRNAIDVYVYYHFTLAPFKSNIDSDIDLAKSFIGKRVNSRLTKQSFIANNFYVIVTTPEDAASQVVKECYAKNGYCVYITNGYMNYIVNALDLCGSITVTLNDNHTAEVFSDKVVVGCQTFTAEKIEELYHALWKMKS